MSETVPESDDTEDSTYVRKPLIFLGTDLTQVACFRRSFIFGMSCGVAGGLLCFLATSKGHMSLNTGIGAGGLGILGYWIPCRLHHEITRAMLDPRNYDYSGDES